MAEPFDLSELNLTEREKEALSGLECWEHHFIHQRVRERMPWLLADELKKWIEEEHFGGSPDLAKVSRMTEAINKLMKLSFRMEEERGDIRKKIVTGEIPVAGI